MAMFDIPKNQMIEPNTFLDDRIIDSIQARFPKGGLETSIIVNNVLEYLRGKDQVPLAQILDFIIPHVIEDDFILRKDYKVRKSVSTVYGKWPQTYGNAFYTDSKYLLQDVLKMIKHNIQRYLKRNDFSEKDRIFVDQMFDLGIKMTTQQSINQFALTVMGQIDNRMHSYIY